MPEFNLYQREQLESLGLAKSYLKNLSTRTRLNLKNAIAPYMAFRAKLDIFSHRHFAQYCTQSCFQNKMSACCSKDGIITFWADLIINADACDAEQIHRIEHAIQYPAEAQKCIFLGPAGCLWQVRPLVCAMFLCDHAQTQAFGNNAEAVRQWEDFRQQAKGFRWPDRPVLFDRLEKMSMAAGVDSPLMYLNGSPGLLQVKRKAGLI